MKYGREAVGLSMALEQSHARFHKNGARPTGTYSVEGAMTPEQYKRLREYITAEMAGIDNAGRPMIMDRAAKWSSTAMSGVDSQHLETRDHQIPEICRFFGVMPIMVGHSDKTATYASAEQMFLAHAIHTARPLHRRFEKSIRRNLLSSEERKEGYYPKFTDTEMLRGAAKDRAEYYARGINAGWLTRNEARGWEELDPIEGLDEPLSPVNMVVGNPPSAEEVAARKPAESTPKTPVEEE
jgi:HK97 family phage portal protein